MVSEESEIEVQCGLSPPIPWGMAMMMGISMLESFDSGVDQLIDVMSEQIEEWAEESGLSGDSDIFLCDNGNEIPADWENDGEDDCGDGSDETGPVATNKYEKMADALLDSNLNKTMEAFADKLERLVEDTSLQSQYTTWKTLVGLCSGGHLTHELSEWHWSWKEG